MRVAFSFARRIAAAIRGPLTLANPDGVPRLRRVIRVLASSIGLHVLVVSIGNGLSDIRITSRCRSSSTTS